MPSAGLLVVPLLAVVLAPTRTSAPLVVQTLVVVVAAVKVVVVGAPAGRGRRAAVVVVGPLLAAASVLGAWRTALLALASVRGRETGRQLAGRSLVKTVVVVFLENA
jgi:hypothetical protein